MWLLLANVFISMRKEKGGRKYDLGTNNTTSSETFTSVAKDKARDNEQTSKVHAVTHQPKNRLTPEATSKCSTCPYCGKYIDSPNHLVFLPDEEKGSGA